MDKRTLYIIDGRARWARKEEVVRCWWVYDGVECDKAGTEWSKKRYTGEECLQLDDGPLFCYLVQNLRVEHRQGRRIVFITTGGVPETLVTLFRASIGARGPQCILS